MPLGTFLALNTWIDLRQGLDEPEALQRLVAGAQGRAIDGVATDQLLAGLCPYRGLLPFREQDAGLFFGRDPVRRRAGRQGRPAHGRQHGGGRRPLRQRQVLDRLCRPVPGAAPREGRWAAGGVGHREPASPGRAAAPAGAGLCPTGAGCRPDRGPRHAQRARGTLPQGRGHRCRAGARPPAGGPGQHPSAALCRPVGGALHPGPAARGQERGGPAPRRGCAAVRRPPPRCRRHGALHPGPQRALRLLPRHPEPRPPARRRSERSGQPRADDRERSCGRDRRPGPGDRQPGASRSDRAPDPRHRPRRDGRAGRPVRHRQAAAARVRARAGLGQADRARRSASASMPGSSRRSRSAPTSSTSICRRRSRRPPSACS